VSAARPSWHSSAPRIAVPVQKLDAIGQLTGGVAHDFNNLLMVIMSSLELVRRRTGTDPKTVQLLENAMQAAMRGASLTQRMLAFARRQELRPVPVEIEALVHSMFDLLERSLGPAFHIEVRLSPRLPGSASTRTSWSSHC
jgi:signal transduction histidine kinase